MMRPLRLTEKDRPLIEMFLADKFSTYVFVAQKLLDNPIQDSIALGIVKDSALKSLLYLSGNAVPISVDDEAALLYANTAYVKYSQFASIVGDYNDVCEFWTTLSKVDTTRQIVSHREHQPYLVLDQTVAFQSNVAIEYITLDDFDQFFDASYAMFVGEVGRAPYNLDAYRTRLYEQVRERRSLGYFDEDRTLRFKVDVPIRCRDVCQVQGVWMHPDWRGQGKSAELFAAALLIIQRDIAPIVTLYVNDFNTPALNLYRRLGFKQIADYSTIFIDI